MVPVSWYTIGDILKQRRKVRLLKLFTKGKSLERSLAALAQLWRRWRVRQSAVSSSRDVLQLLHGGTGIAIVGPWLRGVSEREAAQEGGDDTSGFHFDSLGGLWR